MRDRFGVILIGAAAFACGHHASQSSLDPGVHSLNPQASAEGGLVASDAGVATDGATADARADATSGPGEVLASALPRPTNLRLAGAELFWLTDDALWKMPAAGGAAAKLTSGLVQPDALRVDEARAYWLTYGGQGAGLHAIARAGGAAEDLVLAAAPMPLRDLALDDESVFFTNAPAGKVMKVAKNGGAPSVVASNLDGPTSIEVDGADVFVVESGEPGAIVRVGGGQKVTIASSRPNPRDLALDAQYVYWIDGGAFDPKLQKNVGAAIARAPRAGGAASVVAPVEDASHLAVAGAWVYTCVGDVVMRAPATGGALATFAGAQESPSALAIGLGFVHWSDRGTAAKAWADGSIRRLAP